MWPTSVRERNGEQRLRVDAVEHLLDEGGESHVGEGRADHRAGDQRECHRHSHVPEEQEQEGHQ
jgi:hypothetical protein